MSEFSISCRRATAFGGRSAVVMALALALAACGGKSATPSTQVAAKVGKGEISVHQINFVLQRQGELPPQQREAAQREVLERLIDQELAVQKAQDQKIDRDPAVMQAIEATRRDIIARAYLERLTASVAKPTAEEVKKYHDNHPLLFAQRKLFDLQEVNVRATPEQLAPLSAKLNAVRSQDEAVAVLRGAGLTPDLRQSSLAPETIPQLAERLAALPPGQPMLLNANGGLKIIFVTNTRPAPIGDAEALPRIEGFLHGEAKRQAADQDLKALRAATTIQYTGPFAGSASAPAGGAAPAPAPATPPAKASSSSTTVDDATISRGIK